MTEISEVPIDVPSVEVSRAQKELKDAKSLEKVSDHVTIALTLIDLLYKVIAAAIATAVVAFAAEKTDSFALWSIAGTLAAIIATYSVLIPVKTSLLFREHILSSSWKLRLAVTIFLLLVTLFTVSVFQLLPEIIHYMNDAAHPAMKEISVQH